MRVKRIGSASVVLMMAGLGLAPSSAHACSVCVSPLLDARILSSYYTTGILLTFAALTLFGGFYFMIFRKYMIADRKQAATESTDT